MRTSRSPFGPGTVMTTASLAMTPPYSRHIPGSLSCEFRVRTVVTQRTDTNLSKNVVASLSDGGCTRRGIDLKIVSYNLRKHAAGHELADIAATHDVDVLCLQECDADALPERLHHLILADATKTNRLGLAIYVREARFDIVETKVFAVHKSVHDRVLAPAHERLLAAHLHDRETDEDVLVGSFHAAPLTASNSLRRKQISAAHVGMRSPADDIPAVMVGDFNYPWFIRGLERRLTTT